MIKLGNGDRLQVAQIGAISLVLSSGHVLNLKDIVCVPFMRKNLILIITLDHDRYFCNFRSGKLYLLQDSCIVGFGLLCDKLYKIDLDPNYTNLINVVMSKKKGRIDERSLMLWHKCLGHISKDKIQRLIKEVVLHYLDFSYFNTCIDCTKGKFLVKSKRGKKDQKIKCS